MNVSGSASTRVLVVDYSVDRESGGAISAWLPPSSNPLVFVPDREGFPDPSGFTHVIHSGSARSICDDAPFMEEAVSFIRRASSMGVRQMGICYGHQLLARAFKGLEAVRRNPEGGETGWLAVHWSPAASGMIGIPRVTRVFQFHYDEVVVLPDGGVVLGWSPVTSIESFVSLEAGLFGVQFHPEFDRESGNALFSKERDKIAASGLDADRLIEDGPDPAVDGRFFRFFLSPVWGGR
ncbi:MAG: type 1 glutamine amidotransferase [Candidatus Fermentibacter daniensis]|nr:type 1 glutamine amidotransferase [Candidatus Fermentibacter sp.]